FGPDGTVYAQSLILSAPCVTGIAVQRSYDGGHTWKDPVVAFKHGGCDEGADKNWITVDSSAGSPHRGRVYSVWDEASAPGTPQVLQWSDDRGHTWSPVIRVSEPTSYTV